MQPPVEQIRDSLIAATCAAVGEMAGTEVAARDSSPQTVDHPLGDIAVVVELRSATGGLLVLHFPGRTAAALAGRILAGVTPQVDEDLVRDCMGEIANVVAGQAKALLAETPYRLTFSLPRVVAGSAFQPPRGGDCLTIPFGSKLGEFALQLFLTH
jgi:chemotaxis protein CheX